MTPQYFIRVRGHVDEGWSDYFGNMAITSDEEPDESQVTSLSGQVADQATLFGVLYRLYSLGYELISVEKVVVVLALLGTALVLSRGYEICC